ncbi:amino acid adenylation domain-containing protein [Streptomyces sp. NPDC005727]|uniref:amino acid adenylation domain-containing protein n=1 Tax=Streptomyces sp. NPDC005727 TaxID=3157053 RepID=UPI0033C0259E
MDITSQDTGLDLVRRIRSLPAKRQRAVIALLRKQGVDLSALSAVPRLPRDTGEPLPLSFTQQRLWFLEKLGGTGAAYNIPVAMRLSGRLDRPALLRALAEVVQRHEVLRTRFAEHEGVPGQIVGDGADFTVAQEELTDPARLPEICREEAAAPFDLERGPLVRARLLRRSEEEHHLLVTTHHSVCDGWSVGVFFRDLVACYEAFGAGRPAPLEPLPVQYADWAHWQRQWLADEVQERQVGYWKRQLAGVDPRLTLPTDRERPRVKTYAGAGETFRCPAELLDALREVAKTHDATLYMTLLAAYDVVLNRYTHQSDIAVGTVVAGRNRREAEDLVGFFANTLVMRTDLSGDPAFPELLARVRKTALEAYDHQDVPFEAVVDALDTERGLAHAPVFQTLFVLQEAQTGRSASLGDLDVNPVDVELSFTKFDLTVDLRETPDGLAGTVEYNTDLYDRETVRRFIGHYTRLLEAVAADPSRPLSALSMVDAAERRQVVEVWNDTERPYSADRCLHELFEEAVGRHPERIALVDADRSWTYGELNAWANRVAHGLRGHGVGPDTLVGLHAHRSAEMVAGILGTLKAGGAYLPVEPTHPGARRAALVESTGVQVVLTQPDLDTEPLLGAAHLLGLHRDGTLRDRAGQDVTGGREDDLPAGGELGLTSEHLAYVIHTSGSTGRPKGVMIEHRAAVNRIEWMQNEYRLGADDVVLQKTPYSFDVSVWEFFWPLLSGARLAVAEPGGHRDPAYLVSAVRRFGVTTLHFVPSMLRTIVEEPGWSECATVRQVFCSGEALPPDLCARHHERHPAPLHNLYGPTEAAVDVSHWTCPAGPAPRRVPIGRPIQNIRLYVLNEAREPQGIGCAGELYIAGAGLARGYLHQPELTRERFVLDPFGTPGSRMYRTGDLARWLPDGTLEFLGRADGQVKLRGFRIEPGEIEHRLAEHPAVRACAVLVREDQPGSPRLIAYAVLDPGHPGDDHRAELTRHLAATLPDYMVPSAFVLLDALPVTAHGKLDRAALPAPGTDAFARRAYVAPATRTERLLARVWAELTGFDAGRISAEDNFFALGGHSLMITVLVARLKEHGLNAAVRDVFAEPGLAALAARIDDTAGTDEYSAPPNLIPDGCTRLTPELLPLIDLTQDQLDTITAAVPGGAPNVRDVYPLLSTQEGILFHHLMDPDHDPYLVSTLYAADDEAACARFTAALQAVVDRHDVMRTAVLTTGLPEPVQVVHRTARLPLRRVRLEPGGDAERQARALLDRPERMSLDSAPLLRLTVAEDPDSERRYLLLTAHHLIEDATSLRLTLGELALHMAGRADLLPPPPPYRDFVAHTLGRQAGDEAEEYFRAALGDVTEPTFPFGLADVHGDARRVTRLRRTLPAELTGELRAQARRLRLSPACLFHAAWARVVAACSNRDDVVFGSVMSGRLQGVPGVERMLGNFINTLPLRVRLAGRTVRELIDDVDLALRGLVVREHTPLGLAQRCSGMDGDAPLFSAVANFRHFEPGHDEAGAPRIDDAGVRFVAAADGINYPVSVSVDDFGSELSLDLQVDDSLSADAVAGYLLTALTGLTEALAADDGTGTRALDLDVLPGAERRLLLTEWNDTGTPMPAPTLTAAFAAQAARTPHATALVHEDQALTYAEFDARANRLAHWLTERGAGPERIVGVSMARSFDLLVVIYGILKSGAAYLPLDPDLPDERRETMVADARPLLVLDELPDTTGTADTDPGVGIRPDHPAYVLYTSGTTGRPKGVVVTHRASMNWLAWDQGVYRGGEGDRILFKTSIGFDVSVKELFWPLQVGATIVIARPGGQKDPEYLARAVREHGVTDIDFVPSMLAEFLSEPAAAECTGLVRLEATGEPLSVELAERVARALPGTLLFNLCGPTEVGGALGLYGPYTPEPGATRVPIGAPVYNTQAYVLDNALRPLPAGVPGELYIAGDQLARGFLGRPGLTAERFVANPFTPGTRMYRTGDLVRWRSDGLIEHLGRVDDQVKIRGFRVEPGEIENALHGHPDVHRAVVLPRGTGANRSLVAYVSPVRDPREEAGPDVPLARRLKEHLAARLPDYMVPTAFVVLAELPVNRNGKVDRGALPEPTEADLAREEYVAPHTPTQRELCRIVSEVLGVARVGLDDTFFDLGGHSLLATRLSLRVKKEMGADLPLQAVFTASGMAEMAAVVDRLLSGGQPGAPLTGPAAQSAGGTPAPEGPAAPVDDAPGGQQGPEPAGAPLVPGDGNAPVAREGAAQAAGSAAADGVGSVPGGRGSAAPAGVPVEDTAPLSLQQRDLWFRDRPGHLAAAHDNVQLAFRLDGPLDHDAFVRSVRALVERHPVLRTGYDRDPGGDLTQRVHDAAGFAVTVAPAPGDEAGLAAWLRAERARPFDPQGPYALRSHLLTLADDRHIAVLTRPWGVFDGWSVNIVLTEQQALYRAFARGGEPELTPLPTTYTDFARRQATAVTAEELDRQRDHWRRRLEGAPDQLSVRTDYERCPVKTYQGAQAELSAPGDVAAGLRRLGQEHGATLYMTLLSAFAALLGGETQDPDLVIGTPVANRPDAELEGVVGYFVNMLPMRLDADPRRAFTELLAQAKDATGEAHGHKDVPCADLVGALVPRRDPARSPLFQATFNLLPTWDVPSADDAGALAVTQLRTDAGTSRYDLSLVVQETGGGLAGYLEYSTDLFTPATARRLARAYEHLLARIAQDPGGSLARLRAPAPATGGSRPPAPPTGAAGTQSKGGRRPARRRSGR